MGAVSNHAIKPVQLLIETVDTQGTGTKDSGDTFLRLPQRPKVPAPTSVPELAVHCRVQHIFNVSGFREGDSDNDFYRKNSQRQIRTAWNIITSDEQFHMVWGNTGVGKTIVQLDTGIIRWKGGNELVVIVVPRVNLTYQFAREELKKFINPEFWNRIHLFNGGVSPRERTELLNNLQHGGILVTTAEAGTDLLDDLLERINNPICTLILDECQYWHAWDSSRDPFARIVRLVYRNDFSPHGIPLVAFSATPVISEARFKRVLKDLGGFVSQPHFVLHEMGGDPPAITRRRIPLDDPKYHKQPQLVQAMNEVTVQAQQYLDKAMFVILEKGAPNFNSEVRAAFIRDCGFDPTDFLGPIGSSKSANLFGESRLVRIPGGSPKFENFWEALRIYIKNLPEGFRSWRARKSDRLSIKDALSAVGHIRYLQMTLDYDGHFTFLKRVACLLALNRFGLNSIKLTSGEEYPSAEFRRSGKTLPKFFREMFRFWDPYTLAILQSQSEPKPETPAHILEAFTLLAADGEPLPKIDPRDLRRKLGNWIFTKENGGFLKLLLMRNEIDLLKAMCRDDLPSIRSRFQCMRWKNKFSHVCVEYPPDFDRQSDISRTEFASSAVWALKRARRGGRQVILHCDLSTYTGPQYNEFMHQLAVGLNLPRHAIATQYILSKSSVGLRKDVLNELQTSDAPVIVLSHPQVREDSEISRAERILLLQRIAGRLIEEAGYRHQHSLASLKMQEVISDNLDHFRDSKSIVYLNDNNGATQLAKLLDMRFGGEGIEARAYCSDQSTRFNEETRLRFKAIGSRLNIIVVTDLFGVGVNGTPEQPKGSVQGRDVDRIYCFSVPNTPADLLQLVGRVGRFGRKGRVIFMLTKRQQIRLFRLMRKNKEFQKLAPYQFATAAGASVEIIDMEDPSLEFSAEAM